MPDLAQAYRRFGEVDAVGTLYERVAVGLSESDEAMRVLQSLRRRSPAQSLAALHDLALAGRAPALAEAYAAGDVDAAADAAIDTVLNLTDALPLRKLRSDTGRHAVLYPAIAEVAHRVGTDTIGLIDVGCSAGFNLSVDRVGITYDNGQVLGDNLSPVQMTASVVGDRPIPQVQMPKVVVRVGIDTDPWDVTDPDDARWMRACVWPDQLDRRAMLDEEIALATSRPPILMSGNVIDLLPDAIDRVPAGALPVVTTTWALSKLSVERRAQFVNVLRKIGRPVAWVSAEGVGVAPSIPTFGDRPASGHSIIGLAVFDGSATRFDAVGRCWSRGRLLSWLADSG